MIIDLILDRKDGKKYNPREFYNGVVGYWGTFQDDVMLKIADALDGGTEIEVKRSLARYIIEHEYNLEIIDYIKSVEWL